MPSCQQEVQAWFPWFCIHLYLGKTLYIEAKHFLLTKVKHWHYLVLQYTDTLRIPSPADVAATTFFCNNPIYGLLVDIYINRDRRPEVCNSDMVAILSV